VGRNSNGQIPQYKFDWAANNYLAVNLKGSELPSSPKLTLNYTFKLDNGSTIALWASYN